jgi:dihydropyrimidine dehydrogenase (NAD+) subunit PreT
MVSTALDPDRAESVFADFKGEYTRDQALFEASRCLYCSDPPCVKACPTHIDIPQFIRKIATGNLKGSARTIFDANILGMSCARVCPVETLCVGDCVYNLMHVPPIQIGKLQRFATDRAYAEGWRFFEAGPDTGKTVALLGAGPASLACAHELRRLGHGCTVYEKRPVVGGLNTTGVAPYKMQPDRAADEVDWVLGIGGVDVVTGVSVGEQVSFAELEARHDAVFLGMGLGPDTRLRVPGDELPGVHGAVDFIEEMKLTPLSLAGVRHAVVVGGGNTAMDVVREARGLGVTDVVMLYRGDEAAMGGYAHEWAAAKVEGVRAEWRGVAVGFEAGADGRVARVRCQRLDEKRRPIDGDFFTLPAELVLVAIGQSKLGALVGGLSGIEVAHGRVVTDERGATGRKGYFAGGDCRNGGMEVVNAAAEGKAAARAIDAYLTGGL